MPINRRARPLPPPRLPSGAKQQRLAAPSAWDWARPLAYAHKCRPRALSPPSSQRSAAASCKDHDLRAFCKHLIRTARIYPQARSIRRVVREKASAASYIELPIKRRARPLALAPRPGSPREQRSSAWQLPGPGISDGRGFTRTSAGLAHCHPQAASA